MFRIKKQYEYFNFTKYNVLINKLNNCVCDVKSSGFYNKILLIAIITLF